MSVIIVDNESKRLDQDSAIITVEGTTYESVCSSEARQIASDTAASKFGLTPNGLDLPETPFRPMEDGRPAESQEDFKKLAQLEALRGGKVQRWRRRYKINRSYMR
jgi:hypothetical protein